MTKTHLLAAIAAGALTFAGSQAAAQSGYRMSPAQSLGNSCDDVQSLDSGYVTAVCRTNDGRYRWSSIYYPYCRSDLSNRDGVLSCVGAEGRGGEYIQRQGSSSGAGGLQGAIIGAIAGVLLGGNNDDGGSLYAPGSRYPAWGETGYGDPRYDPRFGEQGWGYGSSRDQWVSISRRGEWLERRIVQGERNGSLTRNEAYTLRRDLSALISLERRYNSGGLSNSERADLDRRFDNLSLRIQMDRRDDQSSWSSIGERRSNLEARINAGVRDRSLTQTEANRLRADFQTLVRLEATYRRNGLTAAERNDLDRRFDLLSARIRDERADGDGSWTSINQRQANLDARIDAGVRDRSLSQAEAARLRADFQMLARMEADYRRNGLTAAERADLDRRFDALSDRIRDERQDGDGSWTSIDQRQADLDARIDAGVRDGSLSRNEASQLRADFQMLARMEADYRRNGLTSAERADLDRRFDVLSNRIRDERQDGDGSWTSIDQRQADLDARIDAGVRDGSLSRNEASQLRADFQMLARMEADYRRNGLTSAERADLDRRFDMLSERIRDDRRDGDVRDGDWTSIDQRQANLDARIDAGVRDRSLSQAEAASLRSDFQMLVRMEADYRRNGLTAAERADLDRRFDDLSQRIRAERRD